MPIPASVCHRRPGHLRVGGLGMFMAVALVLAGPALAQGDETSLRAQVEGLAARHGFAVVGLDRLKPTPAKPLLDAGPVRDLQAILGDYNYMLIQKGGGAIKQLRILGAKLPFQPFYTVETQRRGVHHMIETVLVGPNGERQTATLMLDTGASTIVLPKSMIETLGFRPEALRSGTANTANGPVAIQFGELDRVRVGTAEVRKVRVGFIADDKIGDKSLLGMSFLDHFRLTIDDASNRLTLLAK